MSSRPGVLTGVALLATACALPLAAQQRVEVTARRPAARVEPDSAERMLRRLQKQLDSLSSLYNESDALSVADRRRVNEEMVRAVSQLELLNGRGGDGQVEIRLRGSLSERAATPMARTFVAMQSDAIPRGWIGITVVGPGMQPRIEGNEMIVRYLSYPRVVSVDPSSPAQRAGIEPSDTLLAYDGVDVRENDISLTRLLKPNARVSVRVRRDGHVRDFPVIIAPAPQRIVMRRDDEATAPRDGWVIAGVPNAPAFPSMPALTQMNGAVRASRVAAQAGGIVLPSTPIALEAPRAPTLFNFVGAGVAGMQLSSVTGGLARALGVSTGVLVTSVPVGSPAGESGVVEGDVIVHVAGQAVRTVNDVRQLVGLASQNGSRAVELEILRDKKLQKLPLRW